MSSRTCWETPPNPESTRTPRHKLCGLSRCRLDKTQRPVAQAWCRPKCDLHTCFSLDQTEHFFPEASLIYLASPSIWHINSQTGLLGASQLHFIKELLSPTVGNKPKEIQGGGSVCSLETAGNAPSLHLTQASSLASANSLQVLARSFSPRCEFCILRPLAPQPPRGPLHSEGLASFKKSLIPCLVTNLNRTTAQLYKHIPEHCTGFPPERKVAKRFFTSALVWGQLYSAGHARSEGVTAMRALR